MGNTHCCAQSCLHRQTTIGMPHVTPANPSQSDPVSPPISISTFLFFCYNSSACQYALWLPALCTRLHHPFQVDLTSSEMQALLSLKETICALLLPRREGNKGAHLWTCAYRHQSLSSLSEEVSREKSNSHDLFRYSGVELYLDPDSANTFLGSSHFYSDCQGSWAGSEELNLDHRRISSKLNGTFKALSECWDCGNSLWSLRDYHIVSKKVARTPATFPDSEKRGSTNKPLKQVVYPWDWRCWIGFMNAKETVKNRTQQRCSQRCTATVLFNSFMHLYNVCHFLSPIPLSLLFLLSHFLKKNAWATEFNYSFLAHHGWNVISWSKGNSDNSPRLHHWTKDALPNSF